MDARGFDLRAGLAAKTRQAAHGQGVEHLEDLICGHDGQTVGFGQIGGDLRDQLVGRHADGGRKAGQLADAALDTPRDGDRVPEKLLAGRDIEKRLIERQALNQRGDLVKDAENLPRNLLVTLHPRPDADGMRAQAQCRAHRHRRAHAEFADLVAGCRHHPAAARPPDDNRLAGERCVVALLH